ncbi:MAG: ABC transporter substrate-binding protein [Candidatus Cryptobacteroides sp.]
MRKLLALLACVLFAAAPLNAQTIYRPSEVTVSGDIVTIDGKQYFSHVVRDRQTLYSIGKAYGVSSLDIIDTNPSLNLDRRPIKAGDVLLIPATEQALAAMRKTAASVPDGLQVRAVADTVVPVSDSLSAASDSLHIASVVLPAASDSLVAVADSLCAASDSTAVFPEPIIEEEDDFVYDIPEVIKVCLLLPMDADTTANVRYLNYYFGALLAAKDLGDQGVKLEITTIDTMEPHAFAQAARDFKDSDVIIGPVSAGDISKALPLLPEGKMLVSPMDAKTEELTIDSPVILAATPASRQVLDAVEWMKEEKGEADTLIVVREAGVRLSPSMKLLRNSLKLEEEENLIEVDYAMANGLEMNEWFGVHTHLADTATRVMALSERDVFVKDVIRNVYLQNSLQHNVTIYGPAKTRSSDVEEMCNAYLHNSVTYYVDYDTPEVIRFVSNYRALFHTEPDSFAFHGYDTMRYFVSICAAYGRGWPAKLHKFSQSGLQTHFRFEHTENVGNVNAGLRRVLYTPGFNIYVLDK